MTPLGRRIFRIGHAMAGCTACEPTDPEVNIESPDCSPPRGLILDREAEEGLGCVVAGINPGRTLDDERRYYEGKSDRERQLYKTQVAYFQGVGGAYYGNLKALLHELGIDGPVLWTDVVKCQGKEPPTRKRADLPNRTVTAQCVERFLKRELEAVPAHWPVIAVGVAAYKAMEQHATGRIVVGVPHASGPFSRQLFWRLLTEPGEAENRLRARDAVRGVRPHRVWIRVKRPPRPAQGTG